jgi:pectate lyase
MSPLVLLLAAGACAAQAGRPAPAPPGREAAPSAAAPAAMPAGDAAPVGWASVNDMQQDGTSGGGAAPVVSVATAGALFDALAGDEPRNVLLTGRVSGSFEIGSNKTLAGAPGALLHGHLGLNGSVNVIVRNLVIVGFNCGDSDQCKRGQDAVTLYGSAHHVWFDHCEISDGSDGNMDITDGSDYVTVSWTIFSYSGRRPGDHQFSNLLGSADTADDTDRGHLRITFHHDWWGANVAERMPRVRYGQVHVFNSLYTATGNHYCIGLGAGASLLIENNAFVGVHNPFQTSKFSDATSVLVSRGNLFSGCDGSVEPRGERAFTPPYKYDLQPASVVRAAVSRGAGPPRPAEVGGGEDDENGPPEVP